MVIEARKKRKPEEVFDRFTERTNQTDELANDDILTALREGIQEGEMLTLILKKEPKTFVEFRTRAKNL